MSWFVLIFVMEFSLWKWHYSIVNGWLFKLLVDYWVSLVDVIVKIIYFNLEIMRVKDEWKDWCFYFTKEYGFSFWKNFFLSSPKPFHIVFFFWYRAYRIPVFDRKYSFSVYELTHKSYSWIWWVNVLVWPVWQSLE